MLSREEYIRFSIEVNQFFQRIMKEHLFFIETNLKPVETTFIAKARLLKQSFEQLLSETVHYSKGVISEYAIISNELVTPYTLEAEELNSILTGASINTAITKEQYQLTGVLSPNSSQWLENIVSELNRKSCYILEEVITFQKRLLKLASECKIFITLYHEMLDHDTREAEYYLDILNALQSREYPEKSLCNELNFWNNIMGEHSEFINGMLDPTEKGLKEITEETADKFEDLVKKCIKSNKEDILQKSLEATKEISNFKEASTVNLLNCKIKSIIPPLLADHVLREANHYLRILKIMNQ